VTDDARAEGDQPLDVGEPLRDERGRWLRGTPSPNPGGRPLGELARLREALERVEAERGESLYESIARRAFDDPRLAVALLGKFIPSLAADHVSLSASADTEALIKAEFRQWFGSSTEQSGGSIGANEKPNGDVHD
jgi:hypothetical protein